MYEKSPYEADSLASSTYTKHAPIKDLLFGGSPTAPIPTNLSVHNEGIYQSLPDLTDGCYTNKSAIVAGANGVSLLS